MANTNKDKEKQLTNLCADIRGIFHVYVKLEYVLNAQTTYFCRFLEVGAATFIGKNLGLMVKSYPFNWNDDQKASYLIDLISSNTDLRPYINYCGISWPQNESRDNILEELQMLERLIQDENRERRALRRSLKQEGKVALANEVKDLIWN